MKSQYRFGEVLVALISDGTGCKLTAPRQGKVTRVMRSTMLHSLDEIRGAYQVQASRAAIDPIAADMARALKFAGQLIKQKQESKR